MTKQVKADTALLFVTIGWGTSFWLTKNSISEMPTFTFLAIRFAIAFMISSLIFIKKMRNIGKKELKYGIIAGAVLFFSYATQTVGLCFTTASKSAFITGFSVVLVPLISAIMMKNKVSNKICISVVLAIIGLAMMTLNQGINVINIGDILTLICAVLYAYNIILVGKYTTKIESISFAIIQIGTVAILSVITALFAEKPVVPTRPDIWASIIFLSVVCTSIAFIVQSVAQQYTTASHAALIFSGEPVFAAIFAYIVSGETLSLVGCMGAVLILVGTLYSEFDLKEIFVKSSMGNVVES